YANLTNPQTLNLYALVADDPESFADLDGHDLDPNCGPTNCKEDPGNKNANETQANAAQAEQTTAQKQQATAQNTTNTQQVGNIVHNETGGLRPKTIEGSGSGQDLHNAKVVVSDVIENREKAGINGGVASDKVSSKERNTPQYKDAQQAASEAARSPDVTGGSKNFYLDYGQPKPSWAQGKVTSSYGPFKNAAGGGDVPKGHDVLIIIVHPEDQQ